MLKNSRPKPTYLNPDARLALDDKRLSVLDGIIDGYYESDLRGGLVVVNDSLCKIFGCASETNLLGDEYVHYMDETNVRLIRDAFARVTTTGTPIPAVDCAITRPDGVLAWIAFSIAPLYNAGRIGGFRGIVRDVSAYHHAQKMADEHQHLFQQLSTELSETLDLETVLDTSVRAVKALTGAEGGFIGLLEEDRVRLARVIGGFSERWTPVDVGIVARVIHTQGAEFIEDIESDPDRQPDRPITRAEIVVPLINRGKLTGVLNLETSRTGHFNRDMFERVQLLAARIAAAVVNAHLYAAQQDQLDEIGRKYREISDLESFKTDMIRVAAHDLRNPLALIRSYVDLMAEDLGPQIDESPRKYLKAMRQAVDRMAQMTSDILSLERLNQHREATLMRVSLAGLLDHVVNQYANESRNRGQHIHVYSEPVSVYGDSSEILEAIANLLGNAVKYTPGGGQIEAHLLREDDMALLEIIDTGYGVPSDQLDKLFQPFQRIRTEETQDIDGTGLGLYLVKKIIERYGGQVHVESDYGRGSTFGFRLPLAK